MLYIVTMKKICKKCHIEKDLKDYPESYAKKKDGSPAGDGRRTECRICANIRRKKVYDNNPISRMLMNSKSRSQQSKRGKLEFNITAADVPIPKICPILKIPLVLGKANDYKYAPSIDRIDSSKGYIKGNVRVVSAMANRMKSNASKEQCRAFAENIMKYYDDIV